MTESQLQDLGIVNEQLGLMTQEAEFIKEQNEILRKLEQDQYEEIKLLSNVKNRERITSYVEFGIGIPCLVLGCLPIWTNEQQNIRNLLLGIGGTATAAGVCTFVFTVPF